MPDSNESGIFYFFHLIFDADTLFTDGVWSGREAFG